MAAMRANQITGTTSDFKMGAINHINYGVIQGFPALRRAVTTDVKKYRIFHVCLISPISC